MQNQPEHMPFGKHRGRRLADVAAQDPGYVDWLLAQPWFREKFPVLFEKFASDPLLLRIRQVQRDNALAAEQKSHVIYQANETARLEREARWQQERRDWHRIDYTRRGIWPLGKYKSQPIGIVARDKAYCRWFRGTLYAEVNPELADDLASAAAGEPSATTETVDF